jgi:hypothetical protein
MLQNLYELKTRNRDARESVDMRALSNVWNETEYRFDVYRITNGAHSEIK